MDIKLSDDVLKAALETAVLAAIGEKGREQIIKFAVEEITRFSRDNRGGVSGPLYTIISRQSEQVATAIIKDKLEKDEEFIAFIEGVYRDGVKMFTGMDREKLVTKVADKLSEALVGERRY